MYKIAYVYVNIYTYIIHTYIIHACAHTHPKVENEIFINIIYKSNKQYEKLGNKFNKNM